MIDLSRVSIVVPTRDEAANVPRLLASIPPEPELILCDTSTDGTGDLALRSRPERTRVIPVGPGIAAARQHGAQAATGDILVFTDADVAFAWDYFDRLLARPSWDALYGVKLSVDRHFAGYYRSVAAAQWLTHRIVGIAAASGSNLAIRRDVLARVDGFRPELPCNEDTELFFRVYQRGYQVDFDRRLAVWATDHRRLTRGRLRKSAHSVARNLLLYVACRSPRLPRLLEGDWGYWAPADPARNR